MSVDELEAFIDEGIRLAKEYGYHPTEFIRMCERWKTKEAVRRLVISGEIQSGFKRMKQLGLIDWTIEAAVLNFPSQFDAEVQAAAKWRLEQARAQRV